MLEKDEMSGVDEVRSVVDEVVNVTLAGPGADWSASDYLEWVNKGIEALVSILGCERQEVEYFLSVIGRGLPEPASLYYFRGVRNGLYSSSGRCVVKNEDEDVEDVLEMLTDTLARLNEDLMCCYREKASLSEIETLERAVRLKELEIEILKRVEVGDVGEEGLGKKVIEKH